MEGSLDHQSFSGRRLAGSRCLFDFYWKRGDKLWVKRKEGK